MNMLLQPTESVENELHLRSGVILSIFMGITMVSAVFFGLGYSFGRTGNTARPLATTLSSAASNTPAPPQSASLADAAVETVPQQAIPRTDVPSAIVQATPEKVSTQPALLASVSSPISILPAAADAQR